MERSESLKNLFEAMAKAQHKIGVVAKSEVNPFYKSKYSDLNAIIEASRDVLNDHGLSLIQFPGECVDGDILDGGKQKNGSVKLISMLCHSSGEFISYDFNMPIPYNADAQKVGAAITYARRYAFCSIFKISQEDDDGNSLVKAPVKKESKNDAKSHSEDVKKESEEKFGCSKCGVVVTQTVNDFSIKKHGKALCMGCQKGEDKGAVIDGDKPKYIDGYKPKYKCRGFAKKCNNVVEAYDTYCGGCAFDFYESGGPFTDKELYSYEEEDRYILRQ